MSLQFLKFNIPLADVYKVIQITEVQPSDLPGKNLLSFPCYILWTYNFESLKLAIVDLGRVPSDKIIKKQQVI